jgi:hypothetical protein
MFKPENHAAPDEPGPKSQRFSGDTAVNGDPVGAERLRSVAVSAEPREEVAQVMPAPSPTFVFQIFIDFRGMYRWLLRDGSGHRIRQSRHGFAGLAAAWQDADATRAKEYETATIDSPRLAG